MINIKPIASGSKGNAIRVTDGTTSILLDCGIPFIKIQKALNFETVDACLVTHSHKDHCKGIHEVLATGIDVYMSQDTKEELKITRHNIQTIIGNCDRIEIGDFSIKPFDVSHDVPNLGYIIKNRKTFEQIVFFTDTYYVKYLFPDTTHWIVECNHIKEKLDKNMYDSELTTHLRNRIVKSHMSLETLKDIFKANDLSKTKEIYLTHLSDRNSDAEIMKKEIQSITGVPVYICE